MNNKISEIKSIIEKLLEEGLLEEAKQYLRESEKIFKDSIDYFIIQGIIGYLEGNYKEAEEKFKYSLSLNPNFFEASYNLAIVYLEQNKFLEAIKYFLTSQSIKKEHIPEENTVTEEIIPKIIEDIKTSNLSLEEKLDILKDIKEYLNQYKITNEFASYKDFPNKNWIKQTTYLENWLMINSKKYFVGIYERDKYATFTKKFNSIEELRIYTKCEIFEVGCRNFRWKNKLQFENIIPIVGLVPNSVIKFTINNNNYNINQSIANRYHYYKLKGEVQIESEQNIAIGKPLALKKDSSNKDLVLTLFVDGLSYEFLNQQGIEKLMPNTCNFFGEGVICTETYANSEWTLPSVATICTGQYTTKHQLFHPRRNDKLSEQMQTLFEVYKQKGYITSMINNDWRITPEYGYLRGVDRYIYQMAMADRDVIFESIEHLETFKKSNQYMWLSFMDLHKVADGELGSIYAQSQMSLNEKVNNVKDNNKSVKQKKSIRKIAQYEYAIQKLDRELGCLYHYLEENFNLERCLITLVSDHGQTFLNENENIKFEAERTRVPLLVRGGVKAQSSNELIQLTDYISILTKLSDISLDKGKRDTNLPVCFGGKEERKYTYFESIFPGDSYKAIINTQEYMAYFESVEKVFGDGRVNLDKYKIYIRDKETSEYIEHHEIEDYCVEIIAKHMKYNRMY